MGETEERAMVSRRVLVVGGAAVLVLVVVGGLLSWVGRDFGRPVTIEEVKERPTVGTEPAALTEAPTSGVYEYQGTGGEQLTLPPMSQEQGPTIVGTVSPLDDGCWQFRVDYSSNHWQSWKFCQQGADLVEAGGEGWQRWLVGPAEVSNLTSAQCENTMALPAERVAGQEWAARCVIINDGVEGETISAGTYRYVGDEDVGVGGVSVRTAHFETRRVLSGSQVGTEDIDVWFDIDTGLPVRNKRSITVKTDTMIGETTYQESGSFELISLQPR